MPTFHTMRKIEFVDTDMGGIVHFSRYPVFMETAEHRFREAIGHSVVMHRDGEPIGWPRVAVSIDYHSPARFGETLDIAVRVIRLGEKSMTCRFDLSADGRRVATGRMTSVCCVLDPAGRVEAVPIPEDIARSIEVVDDRDLDPQRA